MISARNKLPKVILRYLLLAYFPSQGQVEKGLCEIADNDTTKRFVVYCGRPSGILPPNAGLASKLTGKLYAAIDVDHLARGLLRVALEGHKERIIENDSLLAL